MTDAQVERCRQRLERFLEDLLQPVGRSERRHWGGVYVRGLLLNGERKSIEPLAERLPDGNVQAMQQFVGQSPWAWKPVWERLGKRMAAELEPDSAWVVDDTGFPKQGDHSVGVARQYSVVSRQGTSARGALLLLLGASSAPSVQQLAGHLSWTMDSLSRWARPRLPGEKPGRWGHLMQVGCAGATVAGCLARRCSGRANSARR